MVSTFLWTKKWTCFDKYHVCTEITEENFQIRLPRKLSGYGHHSSCSNWKNKAKKCLHKNFPSTEVEILALSLPWPHEFGIFCENEWLLFLKVHVSAQQEGTMTWKLQEECLRNCLWPKEDVWVISQPLRPSILLSLNSTLNTGPETEKIDKVLEGSVTV